MRTTNTRNPAPTPINKLRRLRKKTARARPQAKKTVSQSAGGKQPDRQDNDSRHESGQHGIGNARDPGEYFAVGTQAAGERHPERAPEISSGAARQHEQPDPPIRHGGVPTGEQGKRRCRRQGRRATRSIAASIDGSAGRPAHHRRAPVLWRR